MSETNGAAGTTPAAETVSKADYEAAVERARRFEGQLVDKEKTIGEYAKYGDPKTISAMKSAFDELRKTAAKTPEEIDAYLREKEGEIDKRFSGKLSEFETENGTLKSELNKLKLVNPAMLEAAKVFRATELELIQHKIEQELILVDGKICVKGEDGKPKHSVTDPRKLMDVAEYLQTLAAKYPGAALPKGVVTGKEAGETSPAESTTGAGAPPADFSTWSQERQKAWFVANPKALQSFMEGSGKF